MNNTLLIKKSYLNEIAPLSKTYSKGDIHDEIVKIKEWLILWQLNMNDVDIFVDIQNKTFDQATENVVIEFQKFIGLDAAGIVDAQTWQQMVLSCSKPLVLITTTTKIFQIYAAILPSNTYSLGHQN